MVLRPSWSLGLHRWSRV